MEKEEKNREAKEEDLKAKEEELRKAQAEVTRLEGELIKSHDAAAAEGSALKAKLEAAEDQARTTTVLVVSKF